MAALAKTPSTFTQALADEICERVIDGQSLRTIAADPSMPARSSIIKWLSQNEAFAVQYARAREAQADAMDDEILDSARATTNETAQADRVKIDAFKWRAARLAPKKYGDKFLHDHTHTIDIDEARARFAEIMAKCSIPAPSTD
jgi:hypothetical protein